MSTPIQLTPTSWLEQSITQIIHATDSASLSTALDNFLTTDATITLNGANVSRDVYQKSVWVAHTSGDQTSVKFKGGVASGDQENDSVGVFYTATIEIGPNIPPGEGVGPVKRPWMSTSSLNVTTQVFTEIFGGTETKFRRAVSVNQVILDNNFLG